MPSQGGVGGQKIFACFRAYMLFVGQLWSVSRYIMGPFSGRWRLVGRTNPVSNPPTWKCRSGIGDHRFPFSMDLLPNYTFYTNLAFFVLYIFAYRRCDKHDDVQFMKSWENYATSFEAGLTLIPAWISNYINYNGWDEITYPFVNFNGNRWSVGMEKQFHPSLYLAYNYLSMFTSER